MVTFPARCRIYCIQYIEGQYRFHVWKLKCDIQEDWKRRIRQKKAKKKTLKPTVISNWIVEQMLHSTPHIRCKRIKIIIIYQWLKCNERKLKIIIILKQFILVSNETQASQVAIWQRRVFILFKWSTQEKCSLNDSMTQEVRRRDRTIWL